MPEQDWGLSGKQEDAKDYISSKLDKDYKTSTQEELDKAKEDLLFSKVVNKNSPDPENESKPEDTTSEASGGGENIRRKQPSAGGLSDPYNAQYPYNHVTYTESGHAIELDDTPNHERINIQHRSGAGIEIHPDGHIVIAANKLHQQGTELVIGVSGNAKFNVGGDLTAAVGGSAYIGAAEDVAIETMGNATVVSEGRTSIRSTGATSIIGLSDVFVQADAKITIGSSGGIDLQTQGVLNLKGSEVNVSSTGKLNVSSGGAMGIATSAAMSLYGSSIAMNDPGASAPTIKPIPSYEISDSNLQAFMTDLGEMELDFSFPLPEHTAIGPNGETSPSRQAQNMASNAGQPPGAASFYDGPGGVHVPPATKMEVIQGRGPAGEQGRDAGQVEYRLAGAIRNKKLQADMEEIIKYAAKKVNVDVILFSCGQIPASEGGVKGSTRTGSKRHDSGFGSDVWIYTREHKYQFRADRREDHPDTKKCIAFIQACKEKAEEKGETLSAGAGAGYMGGIGIHVDIAIGHTIYKGSARHWAKDGSSAYSPKWLRTLMA